MPCLPVIEICFWEEELCFADTVVGFLACPTRSGNSSPVLATRLTQVSSLETDSCSDAPALVRSGFLNRASFATLAGMVRIPLELLDNEHTPVAAFRLSKTLANPRALSSAPSVLPS